MEYLPRMKSELISVLHQRGFIHQCTNLGDLDELCKTPVSAYIGFDLTADSLHVGSLIQIMVLRWMERLGHSPVVLLGEATTRIGDPTGKSAARPILSSEQISHNCDGIRSVFNRLLPSASFVSNGEWFNDASLFEYLSEYGSHFTINRMVNFETVKRRLEEETPMSFLEFNYMLFQAIDFLKLSQRGISLQIGGSDQWGNIINGVELIRRKDGKEVFGLTTPLMTNSAGDKMGKTANGAVWLDPEKTSPFDFWQFWRNVEDCKVKEFLYLFTELETSDIEWSANINELKVLLANEVTTMVHGKEASLAACRAAFGDASLLAAVPVHGLICDVLIDTKMVKSKGEADRLVQQKGIRIGDEIVTDARVPFPVGTHIIFVGKKRLVRVCAS